jgi:hypothetical protein
MSNEELPKNVNDFLGQVDALIVWTLEGPMAVVPLSDRAKALFIRWGMEPEDDGIVPPDDAADLIESIPNNWIVGMGEPLKEQYILAEIPLPQPLIMVH